MASEAMPMTTINKKLKYTVSCFLVTQTWATKEVSLSQTFYEMFHCNVDIEHPTFCLIALPYYICNILGHSPKPLNYIAHECM